MTLLYENILVKTIKNKTVRTMYHHNKLSFEAVIFASIEALQFTPYRSVSRKRNLR